MEDKEKISLLSGFVRDKIKAKGWSKKEFAVNAGLDETYVYKFLSGKRDFTPTDETLGKMADALELAGEDREYIFEIARRERESGSFVYDEAEEETDPAPSPEVPPESVPPEILPEPVPPAEPVPEPVPPETDPATAPPAEPVPEPVPDPVSVPPEIEQPPVPQPAPSLQPWWMQLPSLLLPAGMVSWIERNRKIFIIGSVLLLAFILGGCCVLAVILSPLGI